MSYLHNKIEKKWQKYWETHRSFEVHLDENKKKYYILDMFPYPSAEGLHVGHPEGYTASDIMARYKRMQGYNVLHPMGFDSFGLPAENYAIQSGQAPKVSTEKNIAHFIQQIQSLGFAYDWTRSVQTHQSQYYRFTQWIFLQMFHKGLAYQKQTPIWYCPELKTVLANEEVLLTSEGPVSERGQHPVVKKNLKQWMLKITDYAQPLLDGLNALDWPESIKSMQRNWIGPSQGYELNFNCFIPESIGWDPREQAEITITEQEKMMDIPVFTTRLDTLFGVTYLVLSPEHKQVPVLTSDQQKPVVAEFLKKMSQKSELERTQLNKDKQGVFLGSYAIHPITGKAIPLWIADYVIDTYATGAVMAVPSHDKRDAEFAQKYQLPFFSVIQAPEQENLKAHPKQQEGKSKTPTEPHIWTEAGVLIHSGEFSGLTSQDAQQKIGQYLTQHKKGHWKSYYRLRDWIFSRQRYWGEPIPIIHCSVCGAVPVPEEELPVRLPPISEYSQEMKQADKPLEVFSDWVNCLCPQCGAKAQRDTNTMPQWAGSCWYYLRYTDAHNDEQLASEEHLKYWLDVDLYIGGAEHAVLHLLYARFWHKFLKDIGYVHTDEPFIKLVNQGMILSYAYKTKQGKLLGADQVQQRQGHYYWAKTSEQVEQIVAKMSKSLKNVVNPDELIEQYGADSLRMYLMFMGPLEEAKPWNTQGLVGVYRFLNRVWNLFDRPWANADMPFQLKKKLHQSLYHIQQQTENLHFNTAVSQFMILIKQAEAQANYREFWEIFVLMLSPYAPHMAEELWEKLGHHSSLVDEKWPEYEKQYLQEQRGTIIFQINGKLRSKKELSLPCQEPEIVEQAYQDEKIKKFLEGQKVVKTIVVPNKLVNFVTE